MDCQVCMLRRMCMACLLHAWTARGHMLRWAAGRQPYDHQLVRQASSLVRRLPAVKSPEFDKAYMTVRPQQTLPMLGGFAVLS